MYNVTDNYKALIAAPVRYTGIRGTIRLKTGEIVRITDGNVVSNSLSIIKKMNGRGDLRPGGVYSSELSIGLKGFSAKTSDLDGAIIGLNFLLYNDSTMQSSETVPLGRFYADGSTIKRKNDTVTLRANDSLMQFDIPATARSGTLFELVSTACSAANVPLGMTQEEFEALPNGTMSAQVNTARIQTERDLLMYIGMATASFARAKREGGQLEFVPLTCEVNESNSIVSARQIRGNVRYTTNFSDDEVRIMKLFFMRNGEKICSTKKYTDSNTSHKITQLELLENPLLESTGDEDAQTVLNNMLVAMVKCLNRAFDTDFNGDPALDIGDYVRCTGGAIDTERSYVKAMITSMVWRYHGRHTIKCTLPSSLSAVETAVATMSADGASEQATEQPERVQPKTQTQKQLDYLSGEFARNTTAQKLQTGAAATFAVTDDNGLIVQNGSAQAVISPSVSGGKETVVIKPGQGFPILSLAGSGADGGEAHISAPYLMADLTPQRLYYNGGKSGHTVEVSGSAQGVITLHTDSNDLNIRWGGDAYQLRLNSAGLTISAGGKQLLALAVGGDFAIGAGDTVLRNSGGVLTFGGKKVMLED